MKFETKAKKALLKLCAAQDTFIVDEVWRYLSRSAVVERRRLGGVMRRAQADGLIERTGDYRLSTQKQCHGNPRPVWRAL